MIEFVFEEELAEEVATEAEGGSFGILPTGVYDVTINFASLDKTSKGNNTLSLDITTSTGHQTTIWSAFGTIDKVWVSGKENFGYKDFQAFMGACGAKSITPTPYQLKKDDGTLIKELSVVKELHGVKCQLAIQLEKDVYNGKVKERNNIYKSFNAKGQNYLEAKSGSKAEQINKIAEKLKDRETKAYKAMSTSTAVVEDEPLGSLLD